jgi:hypothetical protein
MVKQQQTPVEKRVAHFARRCAKLLVELRREGEIDGALRLEAAAIEIVEGMRASARSEGTGSPGIGAAR